MAVWRPSSAHTERCEYCGADRERVLPDYRGKPLYRRCWCIFGLEAQN